MNYDSFKQGILKFLMARIPEPKSIKINVVQRNNGKTLDGLTIIEHHRNISPTIYLDYYYEAYENENVPFPEICQQVLSAYQENSASHNIDIEFFTNLEKVRDLIAFKLINYEQNITLLADLPHIRFLDLAIVFICCVPVDEALGEGTILIHTSHLDFWGINTETLYEIAKENAPRILPAQLDSMLDLLCRMEFPVDEMVHVLDSAPHYPMYVLSNTRGHFGASCILYPDMVKSFSDQMESDLYIIPSSVHEVLLIPTSHGMTTQDIDEMIREVNQTEVPAEDILSDHVYLYQRNENRIIIPS